MAATFGAVTGTAAAAEVKADYILDCGGDIACEKYAGGVPKWVFSFTAAPGEANDATIRLQGDTLTVRDSGAALTTGNRCTRVSDNEASCDLSQFPRTAFVMNGGDGDDMLRVEGALDAEATLRGGPGDDALTGGDEADTLHGGLGLDRLAGGDGSDALIGGETSGAGESIDSDVLDGGPGADLVSYGSSKAQPAAVDLADAGPVQGRAGEADMLRSVERVRGGSGDDRLSGGPGAESLSGEEGDDVLTGGGGGDSLDGGPGTDALDGDAGDDEIDSRDGRADSVTCGSGRDRVYGVRLDGIYLDEEVSVGADSTDVLAGCERLGVEGRGRTRPPFVDPRARLARAVVSVPNPCLTARAPSACRGTVRAGVTGKRGTASARFTSRPGRVRVSLTARAARAAAAGEPIRFRLEVIGRRGAGGTARFSARL